MRKIFEDLMTKSERESWKERTETKYSITTPKTIKVNHDNNLITNKDAWFRFECVEQSHDFPSGITEEQAIAFAGKKGKAWKRTIKIKRLK